MISPQEKEKMRPVYEAYMGKVQAARDCDSAAGAHRREARELYGKIMRREPIERRRKGREYAWSEYHYRDLKGEKCVSCWPYATGTGCIYDGPERREPKRKFFFKERRRENGSIHT